MHRIYDVMSMSVCFLTAEEIHPLVIGIPAYVPIRMDVAQGFTYDNHTDTFETWMRDVAEISHNLESGHIVPRQGNTDLLQVVQEERSLMNVIWRRKKNCIGHILRSESLCVCVCVCLRGRVYVNVHMNVLAKTTPDPFPF